MSSFEIDTCPKCKAESWRYNIEGELMIDKNGRIVMNQIHHQIPLDAWFESFNFKHGTKAKISIEGIEEVN